MSKKFRVRYKSVSYYYVDVDAENERDASRQASNIDGGDFIPDPATKGVGTWDEDTVKEMEAV